MSTNGENEFFVDGITEEIINALAKIKELRVTSRTSSFFFKGKNMPISQIGKELNVSTILEGSARLSGSTIRITAQLIDAEEDFHFWSETWDRKLENIFEIQDEISLLIADRLREHFGHFEINDHLVNKQTDNIIAYEYCLKAQFHKNKWNPVDIQKAISFNEKALELDPNYPEAYLGLADCYSFLGTIGFLPFTEAWAKTLLFTNEALALNDKLSGIYYQLSNHAFFVECDYNKSLQEMIKAITINPNNAEAHQFISFLYIIAGYQKESKQHLDISFSINPLSDENQFFNAYYHYMVEDFSKALTILDRCLTNNNKNIPAHAIKTFCLLKLKRYTDVLHYFDNLPKEAIVNQEKIGVIGLAYSYMKDDINAKIYLNKLIDTSNNNEGVTAYSYLFFMYVVLGEVDKAFSWVEEAFESNSPLLHIRYADPIVSELKSDERYSKYHSKIFNINTTKIELSKKKLLDEEAINKYSTRLLKYFQKSKPYLDQTLSLRNLAEQIDIHPNQLSWLINNSFGKNFNEFINEYRIEEFKIIAKNPNNSQLTIEGLAYESGFNSKTVFNTYFKKETGLTPKQFLRKNEFTKKSL